MRLLLVVLSALAVAAWGSLILPGVGAPLLMAQSVRPEAVKLAVLTLTSVRLAILVYWRWCQGLPGVFST